MKTFQEFKQLPNIYCDLDSVLVNFLGGAEKILDHPFDDPRNGTYKDKWEKLKLAPEFWIGLDWMPSAKNLWNRIRKYNPTILTAIPKNNMMPEVAKEKTLWCVRNLKINPNRVITCLRVEKMRYATTKNGKANVLIDDHAGNVSEWRKAGGIGILHTSVASTLSELTQLGFV